MPQLRDSSSEESVKGNSSATSSKREQQEDPHDSDFSRIFGIETEYGLSVTRTAKRVDPSRAAMVMFEPVITRQRATNTYLTNGSRLYLDVGSHPEYATAEARTPTDALRQDAAGEAVMKRLATKAQEQLVERLDEPDLKLHLYKNNLDAAGNSFGCHENYLLRRNVPLKFIERALIPFLSTRLIWAGAGHVTTSSETVRGLRPSLSSHQVDSDQSRAPFGYEISQRAAVLDEAVSSATTRVRPMINTRDEPHANPDQFRRLHVIVGDSNRSHTSTWLRLATTHLVLCMIEQSVRGKDAEENSTDAHGSETMASDAAGWDQFSEMLSALPPSCRNDPTALMKAISVAEETTAVRDALATQRLYRDAAAWFVREHREELVSSGSIGDFELDEVLRMWDEAIASGEYAVTVADNAAVTGTELTSGMSGVIADAMPDWVEWAAKYRILMAFSRRHPDASPASFKQIELSYHDIAGATVFENLMTRGTMPSRVSPREIKEAVSQPPFGTRAVVRGEFVRKALTSDAEWSCDWTHLEARNGTRRYETQLLDPFTMEMDDSVRAVFSALDTQQK
jgi:proteasome accessory factor A